MILDIDVGMEGIMLVLIFWSRAFEAGVRFGYWSNVSLRIAFTWSSVNFVVFLGWDHVGSARGVSLACV